MQEFGLNGHIWRLISFYDHKEKYIAIKIDFKIANPEQIITHMGATLAKIRLARNLSQDELASMAGISPRSSRRLESGEKRYHARRGVCL
jgi:DNA-binding XRE family transcriptional regulator